MIDSFAHLILLNVHRLLNGSFKEIEDFASPQWGAGE
jgi:hypothetical protein